MNVTELLAQAGGLKSIARELGVSEQQVSSGAAALLPAILGGFKKQAQTQPDGAAGLGGLLQQLGGGALLDKDVSRAVAQNASAQSGVSADLLRKMLPMLAMAVTGMMSRQSGAGAAPAAPSGGLGGLLGGLLKGRGGGLLGMLDADGDGNPLDDIMKMVGKARG
jgi:hypothetical protein